MFFRKKYELTNKDFIKIADILSDQITAYLVKKVDSTLQDVVMEYRQATASLVTKDYCDSEEFLDNIVERILKKQLK